MIKNCLGITTDDLKLSLFDKLNLKLLEWLLGQKCGGGPYGNAAMANFNAFSLYTGKESLNYINSVDSANGRLVGSDMYGFLDDMLPTALDTFGRNECLGKNDPYKYLNQQYGGSSSPYVGAFPSGMPDNVNRGILDWVAQTNFGSASLNGLSPASGNLSPYGAIATGSAGSDYLANADSIFGTSALERITPSQLESFDPYAVTITKCFSTRFSYLNYIVPDDQRVKPIVTPEKIQNLKLLHDTVLLPIYRYYYGMEDTSSCKMRIHGGLCHPRTSNAYLGASLSSKHTDGTAANFSLVSVPPEQVIDDLKNRRIPLEFGVTAQVNGIYICLPYTFREYMVSGVVLDAKNMDADNLDLFFA